MAMGGSYLLNVGPDEKGEIPKEQSKIIKKVGKWYNKAKKALKIGDVFLRIVIQKAETKINRFCL